MKNLILVIFSLFVSNQMFAQQKNYVLTNYSFSFMGTGDIRGSAIGIDYHRNLKGRFGVHLGVSKASGGSNFLLFPDSENFRNGTSNVTIQGTGTSDNIAQYNSYMAGLSYKVADGEKQVLLVGLGLNHKRFKQSYIDLVTTSFDSNSEPIIMAEQFTLVNENEWHGYLSIAYHYYVADNFSLGLHLSVEPGANIISKAGLALGYRF